MTQRKRLPHGGRIDRRYPLEFTFNGKRYEGYEGDTVASALLANGVNVVARSFKYHRPRGIVGSGAEEPNAILQIGRGSRTVPNLRATQTELYEGLEANSVNCWPSVDFDLNAVNGLFSRLMPAGFYYKTFMWPQSLWMKYEDRIRKAAGLGVAPERPDPDTYDKINAHCDVLVVGAGPAGLAAAWAAGRAGARVILADEQSEFGGSLLSSQETIDGDPALAWGTEVVNELAHMDEVQLLNRSTVFGYYDHNFLAIAERLSDHLPPGSSKGPRQRLWRVRAKQVVLATGAIERPLVFANNDRPGVMLASAVSTYIRRYAVLPGSNTVVFTNNDSAYQTALDLATAGAGVTVVDSRPDPQGALPQQVREQGIALIPGHAVVYVQGSKQIEGVRIMALNGESLSGEIRGLPCDLVAVSGGWSPAVHLHSQSGGRNQWDEDKACFVPGEAVQVERSVGACKGSFSLSECLSQGLEAGAQAAQTVGCGDGSAPSMPAVEDRPESPLQPLWVVPKPEQLGRGLKQFVDLQNDTSASDIQLAVREGYHSVEHVKRYTALGFGTDQGKLGNINGMAILAKARDQDIPSTGTTTFRPAYTPVSFGTMTGRDIGEMLDPIRKTAMHSLACRAWCGV